MADRLYKKFKVSEQVRQERGRPDVRLAVASKMDEWRNVGPHLLPENWKEVENEIHHGPWNEKGKRIRLLECWDEKYASEATHEKLIRSLLAAERTDLAEIVCEKLSEGRSEPSSAADHKTRAGEFSLKDAKDKLARVKHLWRRLGGEFGFSDDQLDEIRKDHPDSNPEGWMSIMLEQKAQKELGWLDIVKALIGIGQLVLAREIHEDHCKNSDIQVEERPSVEDLGVDYLFNKNQALLQRHFASLIRFSVSKFEENIEKGNIKLKEVRTYVVTVFHIGNLLPEQSSVDKIFEVTTNEKKWDYLEYFPLCELLEEFVDDEKTRKKQEQYEEAVIGYRSTVRLTDWMRRNELCKKSRHTSPQLPSPDCEELSFKLYPLNITQTTLQYIYKLWDKIKKHFCLNLYAVLHDIERGCVKVTWCVPATENLKEHFQKRLHLSQLFLKKNRNSH